MKKAATKQPDKAAPWGFRRGLRDGIPIGLGYLAVSFSLGIAAAEAGLGAFSGGVASAAITASAGEYALFMLIAEHAVAIEVVIMSLVANIRYMLMSFSLSQRISPETKLRHRLLMGVTVTDEIFGVTIAQPGYLNPFYTYGVYAVAVPMWVLGTVLGVVAGNVLPPRIVSAFGVALYGMFIAIFIPPAKKDKVVAVMVVAAFFTSWLFSVLPGVREISEGVRTIILTVAIAGIGAALFPVDDSRLGPEEEKEAQGTLSPEEGKALRKGGSDE